MDQFICQTKLFLLGFLDSKGTLFQFNLSTMILDNQYNIDDSIINKGIAMNKNQTLWATTVSEKGIHIISMESGMIPILYPYGWYYFYNIHTA
jgi:hypothetical protein